MVCSKAATTEPNVDLVYPVGVDHGEWTGASLRARALVSGVIAKLYSLSKISQAVLSEERARPFL